MVPESRKPCRLRPAALLDLENIWTFTAERWSTTQADSYIAGIAQAFERIAENPQIARERAEHVPPVRILRHQAHVIVYLDVGTYVDIIRIRHGSEDWLNDPMRDGDA